MKQKRKTIYITLIVIVLLILIILLNIIFKEPAVAVEVRKVEYGPIISKVSGEGQLKALRQVNIQAQTFGIVEKLLVKEGDRVTPGQLLCVLDDKNAKAELAMAQAQFEQVKQAYIRSETLFAKSLISLADYETAKTNYQSAKARLEQAEDNYNKTKITSPISGIVTKLNVEEGEAVIIGTMNNPGTILMVIADLTEMIGIIDLDETEIPLVKVNAPAIIRMDAFPDTTLSGKVSKVGYMPKQNIVAGVTQTTDFEVEIKLDNIIPDLRPGMTINAEIITSQKDSVLKIPIQSAGRRKLKGEETQTVFVVEKGNAKLKAIRTGVASETDIEVIDGLLPNELVITGPYKVLSKLQDGARVKYHLP